MKTAFTPKIAYQLIAKAKKNFRTNKIAPREWSKVLDTLPIYICVYPVLRQQAYAWSNLVPFNNTSLGYEIKHNSKYVTTERKKYWLVHEYSSEVMAKAKDETVFNLVAHELAHSLDYVLRNQMQPLSKAHDAFFQVLMGFMGGFDRYSFPERKGSSARAKKTIESFGGAGKVAIDL
jgi:hypothetical protein